MSKNIKILIIVLAGIGVASLVTALVLSGVNVWKALTSPTALLIYMLLAIGGLMIWGKVKK